MVSVRLGSKRTLAEKKVTTYPTILPRPARASALSMRATKSRQPSATVQKSGLHPHGHVNAGTSSAQ
eukprot:14203275-Alexandrium_andersonii.AAC.1